MKETKQCCEKCLGSYGVGKDNWGCIEKGCKCHQQEERKCEHTGTAKDIVGCEICYPKDKLNPPIKEKQKVCECEHPMIESNMVAEFCRVCGLVLRDDSKPFSKGWEEEFDKKFTCLGEKDVDPIFRYCRLDLPDGDNRSIKTFIAKTLLSERAKVREICKRIFIEEVDWSEWGASEEQVAEDFDKYYEEAILSLTEKHK